LRASVCRARILSEDAGNGQQKESGCDGKSAFADWAAETTMRQFLPIPDIHNLTSQLFWDCNASFI
jgi:hypothetical protein